MWLMLFPAVASGFRQQNAAAHMSRREVIVAVHPPPGSGYVQADEDQTKNRFDPWPESYKPNPDYPGTCVPGLGRENQPLSELDLEIHHEDIAFYEVPFHLRWPSNHPYLLGPYDRLAMAGRFVDGDVIDAKNRKNRARSAPKLESVEKLEVFAKTTDEDVAEEDDEEEAEARDPTFDDTSSSLLDAALGLGGDPASTGRSSAGKKNTKKKKKEDTSDDQRDDFLFD